MNTRLGKSFGLAFVVAVGILAVMFALGTFSAQQAGAQDAEDQVDENSIMIDSATPAAGAAVQVKLTFDSGTDATESFGTLEIELEGYDLPEEIEPKDVLIRSASGTPENGLPVDVLVEGGVIILELTESATGDDPTPSISANQDNVIIVLRKRAGITAPGLAGSYDVRIGEETAEDAVTVKPSLSLDPTKGGSETEIEVSGKALADGTGSLYTEALKDPDSNNDGIVDKVVTGDDSTDIPTASANNDWGISVDGNDTADFSLILVPLVQADDGADPPTKEVPAHYVRLRQVMKV